MRHPHILPVQFELHALMELAKHVESQDFVGIGFVAEPKKSVEKYLSQHAQRLQASRQRLSVQSLLHASCDHNHPAAVYHGQSVNIRPTTAALPTICI